MANLTILSFDIYEYHRDELAKMSDKELYDLYINDEDNKIGAYDIDEFTCALNDETIDDQNNWFFLCDFDKATGKDIDIMERLEDIKREQGENDSDKELLVLCSTDEDNTKETYLTISKEDLKAGIHNERIVSELRKIFCVDDYVAQVGDEGEQEFQEAVESLLQGRNAAFECYEWYWQTVLAL